MPNAMSDRQYVAVHGGKCPICRGDDICGDSFDVNGGTCTQEVSCGGCGASWLDRYDLMGYDLVSHGDRAIAVDAAEADEPGHDEPDQ
jgi:hypothetical protein